MQTPVQTMKSYKPGLMGSSFVLPQADGLKGLYLRLIGVPDVRVQLTAAYLFDALSRLPFKSMLDVGCGNGMLTCLAALRYPDASILSIDQDEASISFAIRLAAQNDLDNVRFQLMDAEHEYFRVQIDLITCFGVLQFIRDIPTLLRNFQDMLAPGGHLVLQLPLANKAEFLMKLAFARKRLPNFHEVRRGFTETEITKLLTEAGFEILQLQQIIKGPSIFAKEVFYLLLSLHQKATFILCPLLNWITVFDGKYFGPGQGLFVIARKS
jgi:2-polyprenyl-3-methyl-5-hydroxy-6-metoxy-1,4-benzoquinol methylase